MKILFCRSRTPISWLIRQFTWSDWSHCVLVAPDGVSTVEARWPRVTRSTVEAVRKDNGIVAMVDLPCPYPDTAFNWACTQVGKPYDLRAIFGFILHREWRDDSRWFCSEFVAAAFDAAASPLLRPIALNRVTPQTLWMLPGRDL